MEFVDYVVGDRRSCEVVVEGVVFDEVVSCIDVVCFVFGGLYFGLGDDNVYIEGNVVLFVVMFLVFECYVMGCYVWGGGFEFVDDYVLSYVCFRVFNWIDEVDGVGGDGVRI